jgi:hypothetical protein
MGQQGMFTTGFKFYFGLGFALLVGAMLYGWTSGGVDWGLWPGHMGDMYFAMLGALTLGYKGAVGDHFGYTVLLGGAAVGFTLGAFMVAFRDADAKAVAEVAGTAEAPRLQPVSTPNYWGPLGAFGIGVVALGVAISGWFVLAGIGVLALVAVEWAMSAWADRATGDPTLNARLRARVMNPVEIPVIGVLVVGFVGLGISRVYLATGKLSGVWISIGVAVLIFVSAIVVAAVPKATKNVLVGVVVISACAILAAGIVGAAVGERDFEKHGSEATEHGGGGEATSEGHATEGGATDIEVPGGGEVDFEKGAITGKTQRVTTTTGAEGS